MSDQFSHKFRLPQKFSAALEHEGIGIDKLGRLLDLLSAPEDLAGLSDALLNLLDSANVISQIVPHSESLGELTTMLETAYKNRPLLHRTKPGHDLNAMTGRYEEYPTYSVFTQIARMSEPEETKMHFLTASGVLLAAIWLCDTSWKTVPKGYTEFLKKLRRARKSWQSNDLSTIPTTAKSLRQFIALMPAPAGTLAVKTKLLASTIEERLRVSAPTEAALPAQKLGNHIHSDESYTKSADMGNENAQTFRMKSIARPVVTSRPETLKPTTITIVDPAPSRPGIDSAETGISATLVEAPATQNAITLPDKEEQKYQNLEARFASEFENQLLPHSWESLNEHEVATLVGLIKSTLTDTNGDRTSRVGALITGLLIISSRTPKELADFAISKEGNLSEPDKPTIYINRACWFSPFPKFDRFTPTLEQMAWLKPTGNGCFLSLPEELVSVLSENAGNASTLGQALSCDAEELARLAGEFCRMVRKDARSRANVSWLRSILFSRMLSRSNDEVGSIATLGTTEHATSIGLYYATFEQGKWRRVYSDAITSVGLTPSAVNDLPLLPYGSRQYPDECKLQVWVDQLGQEAAIRCQHASHRDEILVGHNSFAAYTFLMCLANSGHRPSENYTFDGDAIDLENGWAIISDKITSPTTRARLIPLAELVVKQLKNYKTHLHNLSSRLHQYDIELAAKISLLVDPPTHPLMPLFFFLEDDLSVTPITIETLKKKFTIPYAGNAFRHFLASGLRTEEVSAEYIAVLLAHVEIGQYGFGKFSTLSPEAWRKELKPALSSLLEKQGWREITGLSHLRKKLPDLAVQRIRLSAQPKIDLFAKVKEHIGASQEDRQVVRASFMAAKQNTPADAPRETFLQSFRREIESRSADSEDRIGRRLNFHVRFVRMHRHALRPSSIPGWATDMQMEDAVIGPDTLRKAAIADAIRKSIPNLAYNFASATLHQRVALILLSSILMGGLMRESLAIKLSERIKNGVRFFSGLLWVDFDDSHSGGVQRWLPDPATSLLIARHTQLPCGKEQFNSKHLRSELHKLLAKLEVPADLRVKSIADVIELGKAYFTLHLPGLLREYACGKVRSVSLGEGAFLRLLSGRPLSSPQENEAPERNSIRTHQQTDTSTDDALATYKKLLALIRDHFSASHSGATDLKGARKNPLSKLTKSLNEFIEANKEMPSALFAIIAWATHLATEGTAIARHPAVSTIYSYITDFSRLLINFSSEIDFLESEDAELIDIYQRVISDGTIKTKVARAQSLRWFHEFCEKEFDLTELDWNEVAPGIGTENSSVSANLITHIEYLHALDVILKHAPLGRREKLMHAVALILLYRCGLRLGELLRLTVNDLVFGIKDILLVRNGIYGKTKSRAGVRQIPWLDRLTAEELTLLNEWVAHRKSIIQDDPWGALFGNLEEARTLEMRIHISRLLTRTLRTVTGDSSVRIHHLRHAAGTNALVLALTDECAGPQSCNSAAWFNQAAADSAAFREFHLGQGQPTRKIVWAISQALGHSSPRTTVWHYGHMLDYALYEYASSLTALTPSEVSCLSGINRNHLGVMLHRSTDQSAATLALHKIYKNSAPADFGVQLQENPFSPDSVHQDKHIEPISSIKLSHTILTDLSNGFSIPQISYRHAREERDVQIIHQVAQRIERQIGYLEFHLSTREIDSQNTRTDEHSRRLAKLITGYAAKLIPRIKSAIELNYSDETFARGIQTWRNNYARIDKALRLTHPEDLKAFVDFLKLIGISEEQILLSSNSLESIEHNAVRANVKISQKNFVQRGDKFRSAKRTPLGSMQATSLQVLMADEEGVGNAKSPQAGAARSMRKLHHLLFLTSILLEYRNFESKGTSDIKF